MSILIYEYNPLCKYEIAKRRFLSKYSVLRRPSPVTPVLASISPLTMRIIHLISFAGNRY